MAKTINTINNANETTKGSKGNTKNQKIFGSNKGHFVMYRGRGRFSFYSGGWTKRRKIERLPQ